MGFNFIFNNLPEQHLKLEKNENIKVLCISHQHQQNQNGTFIQKVLEAAKFDIEKEEISILLTEQSLAFRDLVKLYPNLELLISFGWNTKHMQLQIDPNLKTFKIRGRKVIITQSVQKLIADKNAKRRLWSDLQEIKLK